MNPIGAVQRWAIAALAVIIVGGLFGGWMRDRGYKAGEAAGDARIAALTAEYAQASAKAADEARIKQAAAQNEIAIIDARHAQELDHAKQDADRVAADLRAGNLRLRQQWRGCEAAAGLPGAAASAGQPDAAAEQRSEGARDLVRVAAEADAQIRALQSVIKADRGNGQPRP